RDPLRCATLSGDTTHEQCNGRYDPDNFGDIPCGDEDASLGDPSATVAALASNSSGSEQALAGLPAPGGNGLGTDMGLEAVTESASTSDLPGTMEAPPRIIGQVHCTDCGGGGGGPAPVSLARFLFYHLD